jgi:DNA-binding transcriptional LysR family regulator
MTAVVAATPTLAPVWRATEKRPLAAPVMPVGAARTTAPVIAGLQAAVNRLEIEVLDTDEVLVVTAGDRRPQAEDGWLVTQTGCVYRELFDRHVASHGVRILAEASTPDALRRLARQGAGRALVPALAVADNLADGALVVDETAPGVGDVIEIVAVHPPSAGPHVHRFLRRAVDHALDTRVSSGSPARSARRHEPE